MIFARGDCVLFKEIAMTVFAMFCGLKKKVQIVYYVNLIIYDGGYNC